MLFAPVTRSKKRQSSFAVGGGRKSHPLTHLACAMIRVIAVTAGDECSDVSPCCEKAHDCFAGRCELAIYIPSHGEICARHPALSDDADLDSILLCTSQVPSFEAVMVYDALGCVRSLSTLKMIPRLLFWY